jgi:uncharacterized membrane protein
MTWFQFLLFVHVAMAVIWAGGALMLQFLGLRVLGSGDPQRLATFGRDVAWIGTRVFVPASLLALLTGILLVVDSDFIGFGDDWIVIGLLLYAVTFVAGAVFFGPEAGRIGALIDQGSPEVGPRLRRLLVLTRLDLVLLFLIVYDMTVKPEIDDQALLEGLLAAALAGGLVYWRYRVAVGQPPPGPGPAAGTPTDPG